MKKHLSSKIIYCLTLALFFGCKTETDFNYVDKNQDSEFQDINSAYTTEQVATKVYFYKQNENGDPELSTYERDTTADIDSTSIPAGTRISQLNSLKSYKGFTFYTATQMDDLLNVYFRRNEVTYEFYSSKANPRLVYTKSGLYGTKVTPPTYTPLEKALVVGWEDSDGNLLGTKYDDTDKKYYPRLLIDALGTKTVPDTKGDILLDDGSVISYVDFKSKSDEDKATLILHAFGVLVMTNYNPDEIATVAPKDGDDCKEFYYKNIGNEDARASISSGDKKLIAAVFKKDDSLYNGLPWISNNDTLSDSSMTLNNYFDGRRNISQLEKLGIKDGDFLQGLNAISSSSDYGSKYCSGTMYTDGWHLPSIGELGVLYDTFFLGIDWDSFVKTFYKTDGNPIWTSNSTAHPYDASAIYTRDAKKSWTVELNNMTTTEKKRDTNAYVIPFLICD